MSDDKQYLMTGQGPPIHNSRALPSAGQQDPATFENARFVEEVTHFGRERADILDAARGAAAHGYFEAYGRIGGAPASKYTCARVMTEAGSRTPVVLRFSTVGSNGSPSSARGPYGFAIKFYTVGGDWDLIGSNLKVSFIRDVVNFPDMIQAFKPDPITNRPEARRFYDFVQHHPESLHMVTWVKSPWGVPASYRHMEGSSVNTFKLVNEGGDAVLCKFLFVPKLGVKNLTSAQAADTQGHVEHAARDLSDAIRRGDYPEWEMCVQIMADGMHPELDFDPLDDTKLWPQDKFPLLPVGKVVLDRSPSNFFADTEQADFGAGALVDGIDFSGDSMLQRRPLGYSDTRRNRVGADYLQQLGRNKTSMTDADYAQAGERYRSFENWERDDLIANLVEDLKQCPENIQLRMVWHFWHCDEEYGRLVAEGAGIDLEKAKRLPPVQGRAAQRSQTDR